MTIDDAKEIVRQKIQYGKFRQYTDPKGRKVNYISTCGPSPHDGGYVCGFVGDLTADKLNERIAYFLSHQPEYIPQLEQP